MFIFTHIPAVIRILLVFILILAAIRKKVALGHAFLGGSILLGLVFGLSPLSITGSAFFSLIHPKTLSLSIVVLLILVLSQSMENAGQMQRLLDRFKGLVRHPGLNIIIFPALIGLLPMPGGAIFSAPMVKALGERQRLDGAQLSYANYWFRHIWEYWWPLYPGVLLTTTIAGLDLWTFVLFLFPLTLISLAAGYQVLRKAIRETAYVAPTGGRTRLAPFLRELTPILMVIVIGLGFGTLLNPAFEARDLTIAKETGLIAALLISIGWIWHRNAIPAAERWAIVSNRELFRMFYMVTAIMIFQGVLKDSRAVAEISRELIGLNISLVPIVVILPFLVGGVVGITIAFVGTAFPILISLIHSLGQGHLMLPYMMLAMTGGFMGVLFSPLHLCLLLSNEYFHTSLTAVYRHLWAPCAALLVSGLAYFWVLRHFLSG